MSEEKYIKIDYEKIPNKTTRLILKLITNLKDKNLDKTQDKKGRNYEKEINK